MEDAIFDFLSGVLGGLIQLITNLWFVLFAQNSIIGIVVILIIVLFIILNIWSYFKKDDKSS